MANKLTDNDIKKALECCAKNNCTQDCPFYYDSCIKCKYSSSEIISFAFDLINRLQAEIERLGKELIKQQLKNNMLYETAKEAKSEAIKELAERVKPIMTEMFNLMIDDDEGKCIIENCKKHSSIPCMNEYCIKENKDAWEAKIDNLIKEMTEGD